MHLPTLASLWETTYGKTMLVKVGLLTAAIALAAVNLLRSKPGLARRAVDGELLLRRLVSGEVLLVAAAVVGGALLSSLPPPAKALALEGGALARVGPGPVGDGRDEERLHAAARGRAERGRGAEPLRAEDQQGGKPVRGADVKVSFAMLDMEMGEQAYQLTETAPGVYVAEGARARDGRPLGPAVRRHAEGRRAVRARSSSTGSTG